MSIARGKVGWRLAKTIWKQDLQACLVFWLPVPGLGPVYFSVCFPRGKENWGKKTGGGGKDHWRGVSPGGVDTHRLCH